MNAHKSERIRGFILVGTASLAIAVGTLANLSTLAQQAPAAGGRGGRGGGGQGTPVAGPNGEVWGFTDTAFNPDSRWRIHDAERPQPPSITPGETVSVPAPSDAIILFNGKDLSQWVNRGANGADSSATWLVRDGYFEA